MHPLAGQNVIVAWKSPFEGEVDIQGKFEKMDPTCGNGVSWAIYTENFLTASGDIPAAGVNTFNVRGFPMKVGYSLYFILIAKNGDNRCDSTELDVVITGVKQTAERKVVISDVHVNQAVQDFKLPGSPADFDLVQGKSTLVEATIHAQNFAAGDGATILVTAKLDDGTSLSQTVSAAEAMKTSGSKVLLLPFNPGIAGNSHITVSAQAPDTRNITPVVKTVRVKATRPLKIGYFSLAGSFDCSHWLPTRSCDPYGALELDPANNVVGGKVLQPVELFATKASEYMQAIFPVRDGGISYKFSEIPMKAQSTFSGKAGLVYQNMLLAYQRLSLDGNLDRVVGIVGPHYFDDSEPGAGGFTSGAFDFTGSTVMQYFWTVAAHEVIHSFVSDPKHSSSVTQGFNLNSSEGMAFGPVKNAMNIMNPDVAPDRTLNNVWIDSNFYASVFKSLLLNSQDPELLVVAGVLHASGAVEILPVNYVPEGNVSLSNPENNSRVVLRNESGLEIGSASFETSYSSEIIPSRGATVTTDISPFVVKLPYSADVSVIEVESEGKVVKTILPNSALLLDTIRAIAATSYKKFPEISRRLFLAAASEIENINNKCIDNALKKKSVLREEERIELCGELRATLTLKLRDAIAKDLNDSLVKSDPLELIKNEALQRIDAVLLRLVPNQIEEGNKSHYTIRILPYRFGSNDQSILKIQSVTQGSNGNVSFNSSGYVEYIPNSKPALADTFTITVENSWGAKVIKTVTISPRR